MDMREKIRLPGFTADASVVVGRLMYARTFSTFDSDAKVMPAGSEICNCNCAGGQPSSGSAAAGTAGPPGVCSCSSVAGLFCSISSNSCNPGFVPQCNCGVIGNSCACVPGAT
jgi:hypothetical protein